MTRRNLAVGCGSAVLVALLVAGCGLASLYSQLPAGEHPEVDFVSDEITAARDAKATELEAALVGVERRFGARYVGVPGLHDRCEEGQDNFTREDRWAYTCRIAITRVLPLGDPFRESASSLGEALLEGECSDGTDTDRELGRFSGDPQDLNGSSGDCTPGTFTAGAAEIAGWPRPSDAGRAPARRGTALRSLLRDGRTLQARSARSACCRRRRSGPRRLARGPHRPRHVLHDPMGVLVAGIVVQGQLLASRLRRALAFLVPGEL